MNNYIKKQAWMIIFASYWHNITAYIGIRKTFKTKNNLVWLNIHTQDCSLNDIWFTRFQPIRLLLWKLYLVATDDFMAPLNSKHIDIIICHPVAVRMVWVKSADTVIVGMEPCTLTSHLSFMNYFLHRQREGPDNLIVFSAFNSCDITVQSPDA